LAAENKCQDILEETATAQEKEEAADSVRARDMAAAVILGSFAPQKKRGKTIYLD
jgi:hypothetical protein